MVEGVDESSFVVDYSEWRHLTLSEQTQSVNQPCLKTDLPHHQTTQKLYSPAVFWLSLIVWRSLLPYAYSCKASCVRPGCASFVIFDIRALWMPGCQKITNDGTTRYGTGCTHYGNSWRQRWQHACRRLPLSTKVVGEQNVISSTSVSLMTDVQLHWLVV